MENEFYYAKNDRLKLGSQVLFGLLIIPNRVRPFFDLNRDYAVVNSIEDQYKAVELYPTKDNPEISSSMIVQKKPAGLILPKSSIDHLALTPADNLVHLIGMGKYLQVLREDDWRKYIWNADNKEAMAAIARKGI